MIIDRVFVSCIGCSNEGFLAGSWFDADELSEVQVSDICKSTAEHEELRISDVEGIGAKLIGEYTAIATIVRLFENTEHLDDDECDALVAWIEHMGLSQVDLADDGLVDNFREAYSATCSDEETFARDLVDDIYGSDLGPLGKYIDWEYYTRDLFIEDYVSYPSQFGGVHVFRRM